MALSACAQKPIIQRIVPPNPFGYQKVSAVCHVGPVQKAANGALSATMTVRSDDGLCALPVRTAANTNYASFGVSPAPKHGKAFLYNYDDATYVNYTPSTAYAGTDSFTAILIPGNGQPRVSLTVNATVDATGVVVAKPAVVPPTPAETVKKTKTTTRRRTTKSSHK